MQNIDEAAFRLAQKIDDHDPNIWREDHINQVCNTLVTSGYESQPAMYAALTQVAKLDNQNSMAFFDLELSTRDVVFIRHPKWHEPQAVFVDDMIRNLENDQAAA